eukprot:TRINITY_DN3047_c0_g1_i4.p1 TRINITY_DN3047_c0_g1~~TRINITY_DN3047_c0_g1_i4.p1  ORF type:complete len:108 (+),score=28.87 TRINITY_DN3047_c0_g1_i4:50-373(+)
MCIRDRNQGGYPQGYGGPMQGGYPQQGYGMQGGYPQQGYPAQQYQGAGYGAGQLPGQDSYKKPFLGKYDDKAPNINVLGFQVAGGGGGGKKKKDKGKKDKDKKKKKK